jgi:hypothetical protein
MRRLLVLWAVLAVSTGIVLEASVQSTYKPSPVGITRTSVDQPDDVTGYQIHVMYVLPSAEVDPQLDINGKLAIWLAAARLEVFVNQ